jgi:glyoxylase-like metal-dependent hydrolase (beta-lactamase superfamily II)
MRAVVGDAIFPGGPGHTNSPQELSQALLSLRRSVFTWADETELFPGHGRSTRVGQERAGFEAFMARPLPPDLFGDIGW